MFRIDVESPSDIQLLAMNNLPLEKYNRILSVVKNANNTYYHLSETHERFFKILNLSDEMISKDPDFRFMDPSEQQEWLKIRNLKTGIRGHINRHLISELKKTLPRIFEDLIEPQLPSEGHSPAAESLTLSNEIDTLLLSGSVPAYFEYLEKITLYKRGVFNQLQRGYISFLQVRAIQLISLFLEAFERDLTIIEDCLLDESQIQALPKMGKIISQLCDRADAHHHDPISLYAINCIRSIYISFFNIAITLLQSNKPVPREIRQILPVIPDIIDFTRKRLEIDDAWKRYHDHNFLFMRLPREHKASLVDCLRNLSSSQRVMWMGCLGKVEIQELVLPILPRGRHFEKLAYACREALRSDKENQEFVSRVWDVLSDIYAGHLILKKSTSKATRLLFKHIRKAKPMTAYQVTAQEQADLSTIRDYSFLVVDDSDRIRQMTIQVLKDAGIKTISAAVNGLEAWQFLQKQPVDVILCDWIMPEMTGIELAQKMMQIEKLASRTTFLMLTTVNSKASIVEALSVGVRGFLIKPFSRKQLLEKVYFATEWLRKEQDSEKTGLKKQQLSTSA